MDILHVLIAGREVNQMDEKVVFLLFSLPNLVSKSF